MSKQSMREETERLIKEAMERKSVTITQGETEAFEEGSVGWGVTRPTITLPNGVTFSPRWSAVFHQEDGVWKLVQLHASIGQGNEEALGMGKTLFKRFVVFSPMTLLPSEPAIDRGNGCFSILNMFPHLQPNRHEGEGI